MVRVVYSKIDRLKKELDIAIEEGDLELALAVTSDMVEVEPDIAHHHTSKGVIYAKLDRLEEALEELDLALEIDQGDPKAWYSKGCVLMDNGKPKPALACLYKSLDLDPAQTRSRDRFIRCLDQMVAKIAVERTQEILHDGPTLVREDREGRPIYESQMDDEDEEEGDEEDEDLEGGGFEGSMTVDRPPLPEEEPELPRRRRKGGSLLDEDLFSDEEELEEVADWGDEEETDDWGFDDEEEDADDQQDDEEDWGDEDENPVGTIECRCGTEIPIFSADRPYKFECPSCRRTGTLR